MITSHKIPGPIELMEIKQISLRINYLHAKFFRRNRSIHLRSGDTRGQGSSNDDIDDVVPI